MHISELEEELDIYRDKQMDIIDECGCKKCDRYLQEKCERTIEHFPNCSSCNFYVRVEQACTELDKIQDEYDYYLEFVYAKAIYDLYSDKKPKLKDTKTGRTIEWDSVFGDSYDKLSRGTRYALIGLAENGRYRIKGILRQ